MKHRFLYDGPSPLLRDRQLLTQKVEAFHRDEIRRATSVSRRSAEWTLRLGDDLLFNAEGLNLLSDALDRVESSSRARFSLRIDAATRDVYYSLDAPGDDRVDGIDLGVEAVRDGAAETPWETVVVTLPATRHEIPFPESLRPPTTMPLPGALLMNALSEFDLLFGNQIAVVNRLAGAAKASASAWIKSVFRHRDQPWPKRVALNFSRVDPTAHVHPTAVIEGSFIGAGAVVGAHCVVRFSVVGKDARLHDGAKVEFSVVGEKSWLMHDLVLYRSLAEDRVFLIHGPYQFSVFQSRSAAFATILMDYRPDAKPIRVMTPRGVRDYRGGFLGALLKEGAKTLGGALVAPGSIVPAETWLSVPPESVHGRNLREKIPTGVPVAPGLESTPAAVALPTLPDFPIFRNELTNGGRHDAARTG